MDHVTYILIMFRYAPDFSIGFCLFLLPDCPINLPYLTHSIAFLLYAHVVFLITLYATSGRNAPEAAHMKQHDDSRGGIELAPTRPPAPRGGGAWYTRVRSEEPVHVIGSDENDER